MWRSRRVVIMSEFLIFLKNSTCTVDELEPKGQNQKSPHRNVNRLNTMH